MRNAVGGGGAAHRGRAAAPDPADLALAARPRRGRLRAQARGRAGEELRDHAVRAALLRDRGRVAERIRDLRRRDLHPQRHHHGVERHQRARGRDRARDRPRDRAPPRAERQAPAQHGLRREHRGVRALRLHRRSRRPARPGGRAAAHGAGRDRLPEPLHARVRGPGRHARGQGPDQVRLRSRGDGAAVPHAAGRAGQRGSAPLPAGSPDQRGAHQLGREADPGGRLAGRQERRPRSARDHPGTHQADFRNRLGRHGRRRRRRRGRWRRGGQVSRPATLGELRAAGYRTRSVREELRENLLARLRREEPLFPGMIGYDESVIPAVEHAILAGHDMIFLGERGQGKSRMIRMLVELLDAEVPILAGSELHDDPLAPVSEHGRRLVAEHGDAAPIAWIGRAERYGEKLATPDVTIADLLGEIDPIKVAEGRYLADQATIHYGLIPRTNRGIFCVNELPDLPERVQVGLFNVLEERDFQVKGFKVRLPLDVLVVASANPEDYTRRGRIITPLKDRYQTQIRTHYPQTRALEIAVMEQEGRRGASERMPFCVPEFLKEIVAEITLQARQSPDINQLSGVSVRASIANYETIIAEAERRALRLGEREAVPRLTDLPGLRASMSGKMELEYAGAEKSEGEILENLVKRAVLEVFGEHSRVLDLDAIVRAFDDGWKVEVGEELPSKEYADGVDNIAGLRKAVELLGCGQTPARIAAAVEFVLEGLHLSNKLNREVTGRRLTYG